jgi:hypothetical protein
MSESQEAENINECGEKPPFDAERSKESRKTIQAITEFLTSQVHPIPVSFETSYDSPQIVEADLPDRVLNARDRALTQAYDRLARIFTSDPGDDE